MTDEIIRELWKTKEQIAKEHGYDVKALAAYFQSRKLPEGKQQVNLRAIKDAAKRNPPKDEKP